MLSLMPLANNKITQYVHSVPKERMRDSFVPSKTNFLSRATGEIANVEVV